MVQPQNHQSMKSEVPQYQEYHQSDQNGDRFFDIFLRPRDTTVAMFFEDDRKEFNAFRREDFNLYLTIFVTGLLGLYFLLWGSVYNFWYLSNHYFTVAFCCGLVTSISGVLAVFQRICVVACSRDVRIFQRFHKYAMEMENSSIIHVVDKIVMIGVSTTVGFYSLARSTAGQCPDGITPFNVQNCNYNGAGNSPPIDQLVLSIMAPLVIQKFYSGVSISSIVVAWVISIALTNASLNVVDTTPSQWVLMNVMFMLTMSVSYEIEYSVLIRFVHKKVLDHSSEVRMQLADDVEAMRTAAVQAEINTKRNMIRYITHEIRSPLNNISGNMEALKHELNMSREHINPDLFEIVAATSEAASLARDIVTDLLGFEMLAAGLYRIEAQPVKVLHFLLETARPFIVAAKAKKIDFTFQKVGVTDDTTVHIDPVKFAQVVRNTLSNAIKFTPELRRITVSMTLMRANSSMSGQGRAASPSSRQASPPGEFVTIAVCDQGPGLRAEDLQLLFQEGRQFNSNQLQAGVGSGLGLFIAKGIAMLHEGCRIWAESEGFGHGCTFFIVLPTVPSVADPRGGGGFGGELSALPSLKLSRGVQNPVVVHDGIADAAFVAAIEGRLCEDPAGDQGAGGSGLATSARHISSIVVQGKPQMHRIENEASSMATAPPLVPAEAHGIDVKKLTILVVDDSPAVRKTLERVLELDGHSCIQASNGLEAFAMAKCLMIARDTASVKVARFDAIVLDSNMPEMSGPEATKEIRKLGFTGPIIGLSGDEDMGPMFLAAGADAVLVRPASRRDIATVLRDALQAREIGHLGGCTTASVQARGLGMGSIEHRSVEGSVGPMSAAASGRKQLGSLMTNSTRARLGLRPMSMMSMRPGSSQGRMSHLQLQSLMSPSRSQLPLQPVRRGSSSDGNRWTGSVRQGTSKVAPEASKRHSAGNDRSSKKLAQTRKTLMRQSYESFATNSAMDVFLKLKSTTMQVTYREYSREVASGGNALRQVCVGLVVVFAATRGSLYSLWFLHPMFYAAFVSLCLWLACVVCATWCQHCSAPPQSSLQPWAVRCLKSRWMQTACTDGVLWTATATVCLYLLARVLQGSCDVDSGLWNEQQCNPESIASEVPQEQLLLVMATALICQVFAPGASRLSLAGAWAVKAVLVNVSMYAAGSSLFFWNNCVLVCLAAVAYEYERHTLWAFALFYEQISSTADLEDRQTVLAAAIQYERDQAMTVNDELRCTIANSAHDLKSPTTALALALQLLIEKHQEATVRGAGGGRGHAGVLRGETLETLWDLYFTSLTISMIINRSTDYCKVVANIGLTPIMVPVNLRDCLQLIMHAARCLHMQPAPTDAADGSVCGVNVETLSMLPMSNDVPEEGMTDENWLRDNLLCIIANAAKYSTTTTVKRAVIPRSAASMSALDELAGALVESTSAVIVFRVKAVYIHGAKMVEFSVQDSGPEKLSPTSLKALFDRPIQFVRERVGGMGMGLFCLAERVAALGGGCGARLRSDRLPGTVVWFRIPFQPPPAGRRVVPSTLMYSHITNASRFPSVARAATGRAPTMTDETTTCRGMKNSASDVFVGDWRLSWIDGMPSTDTGAVPHRITSPSFLGSAKTVTKEQAALPLTGVSVLCVDDSPSILKMIMRVLSNVGATVCSARDGREALQITKVRSFDVVVTDIQMPNVNGWELCKGLRKRPGGGSYIIIGISAKSDPSMTADADRCGMDAFLMKPFRVDEIIEIIKTRRQGKEQ